MDIKKISLSIAAGLLLVNGVLAHQPGKEFDIHSITYIEEEVEINLGFDTKDYLPEDFNPYQVYFNLDSVAYLEEELPELLGLEEYLPSDFDAYAYPKTVESFNYIDPTDEITLDFEPELYLSESFDAFASR